ncbi:amidohydrolase family protein [Cordyceps militaris CM01]|uniref:Amidohydrolase family protein n=1 Tax=Cordyceps militaris (strain CM01) TaxID=983644 RepID=G3JS23_CORMM|nr:amidohydrolase family protein [Cordyceps militaris CM01]EGX88669.1 amidohydrolase family protein [Cordyceps militaris CM01]
MADTTIFVNGRIYTSTADQHAQVPVFAECMVVADGLIRHVGASTDEPVQAARAAGAPTQDLAGRYLLPGFIDGHLHLLMVGQALQKISLDHCRTLADVRAAIAAGAAAHPAATRLFARGWTHSMTPDGVHCGDLDDIDPRPIFVDTKDLHSTWCNSAALAEVCERMGLPHDAPDLPGGTLQRGPDGRLNGVFNEGAVFQLIWPFVATVASMDEKMAAIKAAIAHFSSAGYTGIVDMAMDDNIWEPLMALRAHEGLGPMRIAAYWLLKPHDSLDAVLAQIDRAADMATGARGPGDSAGVAAAARRGALRARVRLPRVRRRRRHAGAGVRRAHRAAPAAAESAVAGATHGSAYSCFADKETGSLEVGKKADFVVVEGELLPEKLMEAVSGLGAGSEFQFL